jgi:imidazolonepropionase-like amidohydrolase
LTALRAGVDTVEHATYLTDECVVLARQSGAIIVPTVALREAFLASLNDDSYEMPAWRKQKQSDAIGAIESGFRLAYQAGLPIAAGSDFMGVPLREHGRNAREPISMVSLGMTHVDALRAATSTAAMALGLGDTIGRLQAGYDADVIALADDPSVDITALERVIVVIRQGLLKRWDRQELPAGAATIAPI